MGHLRHLLAQPVSRSRWLLERLITATALLVVGGIVAGVCAWLGAEIQHAHVSFPSLLGAGLNVIPAALCILGVGALAMGLWPRATKTATYGCSSGPYSSRSSPAPVRSIIGCSTRRSSIRWRPRPPLPPI